MDVALREEPLRSSTAAVDDLGEMSDGFGVSAGVEGGDRGGLAADEELDVAEEMRDALGLGLRWGLWLVVDQILTGMREFVEGKDVVGERDALAAECGRGEALSSLEEHHRLLH